MSEKLTEPKDLRIIVAVTGASGSIYAERLISELLIRVKRIYLIASDSGKDVCKYELTSQKKDFSLIAALKGNISPEHSQILRVFRNKDLFAPVASGSSVPTHMVVLPCSMGTLARINLGCSGNLLERAADVMIKEKQPLLLCPRETPLSTIHLRNMLSLSEMGVSIIPAMPAFYHKPKSIEDMIDAYIGRVLSALNLDHKLYKQWNSRMI